MKKVLLVLFAIIIGINLNTQAEDFSAVNNGATIYYEITSSTVPYEVAVTYRGTTYSSFSNEYSGAVSIPDSVLFNNNYYKVTSIGIRAFSDCSVLTSITIPNSITSIGNYAFMYCGSLTSITISNSVTSIGVNAFYYCSGLTSFTIPSSVTSIGASAFNGCDGLTSITIPNSVISIGNSAFESCNGLTSINVDLNNIRYSSINGVLFNKVVDTLIIYPMGKTGSYSIPNSVTSIGGGAFWGCGGLTSITIPNSITSIGSQAFFGCSGLTSIIIPNSVTSIGSSAFYGCSGLTSIVIPNSVTSISSGVFCYCTGLTSITIPNAITSIGNSAFFYCSGLTSITIPNSVTSIGNSAFSNCSGLTSMISESVNPPITVFDSYVFNNVNKSIPLYVPCASIPSYQSASNWSEFTNYIGIRTAQYIIDTICENQPYTNYGANIDSAGVYHLVSGCDSIILTLSIKPTFQTDYCDTICQRELYNNYGFSFFADTSGIYKYNLQAVNSCDSVICLNLIVNPIYNDTIISEICQGGTYSLNGFNESNAGFYTQNLQTIKGCDSIVTLSLILNPIYNDTIHTEICQGETYNQFGFNESIAGFYTLNLQTIKGCDSIVNLSLLVNPIYNDTIIEEICQGEIYTFNGFNESTTGFYTHNLQTIKGCDSIINLNLIVNPTPDIPSSLIINQMPNYFELTWQSNGSSYIIYRNNDSLTTVNMPIYLDYNVINGQPYCYKIKAINGDCESEFSNVVCKSYVGLNDISSSNITTKLYPNPTNNKSKLEVEGLKSEANVIVSDLLGRVIKSYKINPTNNELEIDVNEFAKGVYNIRIMNDSINQTKKLIVQ